MRLFYTALRLSRRAWISWHRIPGWGCCGQTNALADLEKNKYSDSLNSSTSFRGYHRIWLRSSARTANSAKVLTATLKISLPYIFILWRFFENLPGVTSILYQTPLANYDILNSKIMPSTKSYSNHLYLFWILPFVDSIIDISLRIGTFFVHNAFMICTYCRV